MKRSPGALTTYGLIATVIVPLGVSIAWKDSIGVCDYIAQGGLFLSMIVFPFCIPRESGFVSLLSLVYATWIAWGLWRFFYFDPVTKNDIPGIGYLIAPLLYCLVSAILFATRKVAARRLAAKTG